MFSGLFVREKHFRVEFPFSLKLNDEKKTIYYEKVEEWSEILRKNRHICK